MGTVIEWNLWRTRRFAAAAFFAVMLFLTIGYTMLGLWILAQPIVAPNVAAA